MLRKIWRIRVYESIFKFFSDLISTWWIIKIVFYKNFCHIIRSIFDDTMNLYSFLKGRNFCKTLTFLKCAKRWTLNLRAENGCLFGTEIDTRKHVNNIVHHVSLRSTFSFSKSHIIYRSTQRWHYHLHNPSK